MTKKTILFINIRPHKVERLEPLKVAKRMGLKVVLLADKDPNIPSIHKDYIDDMIITDTFDFKKSLQLVKEYHSKNPISGVLTWADKDVELVAFIGSELNLPALSLEAAKNARNKYSMREAMEKAQADLCPKFYYVETYDDLLVASEKLSLPLIFKPVGASGSSAIFKIDESTDLEETFNSMLQVTKDNGKNIYTYYPNQYIVEEFIDGQEVSVDGLISNHEVYIAGVTNKDVTEDFSLEYTAFFPSNLPENIISELKEKTKIALEALGLNNCPFHLEARVSSKGIRILEVAARAGGGFITSHLIPYASGHSLHEQMIRGAIGLPIEWKEFDSISNCFAGMTLPLPESSGILNRMNGLDSALEVEGIKFIIPIKEIGESIKLPPNDFKPFLAWIIGTHCDYELLVSSLKSARESITCEIH